MFTGFHPIRPYVKLSRVGKKSSLKRHFCLVSKMDDCSMNVSSSAAGFRDAGRLVFLRGFRHEVVLHQVPAQHLERIAR